MHKSLEFSGSNDQSSEPIIRTKSLYSKDYPNTFHCPSPWNASYQSFVAVQENIPTEHGFEAEV
jgi:hypothetical protein